MRRGGAEREREEDEMGTEGEEERGEGEVKRRECGLTAPL